MARDIITLISKINDRNLQKRRESGLTSYAILSIIAIIFLQLLDVVPECNFQGNTLQKLFVLSLIYNLSFSCFCIYYNYSSTNAYSNSAKVVSRIFSQDTIFEKVCTIIFLWAPALLSGYIFIYQALDWYIVSINAFYLAYFLLTFFIFIQTNKEERHFKYSFEKPGNRSDEIVFLYFLFLAIIVATLIYCFSLSIPFDPKPIIKLGVYTSAIPILLNVFFELKKHDFLSGGLEDLETEIYLRDLKDEEVIKMLKDKYLGIDINGWIELQKENLSVIKEKYFRRISDLQKFIDETNIIDKVSYPREVDSRKTEISSKSKAIKSAFSEEMEKFKNDLKYMKQNLSDHRLEFLQYSKFLQSEIEGEVNSAITLLEKK